MSPNIERIFNRRDSKDSNLELREYGVGAQILLELGLHKIILLSNSNKKNIWEDDAQEIIDKINNFLRKLKTFLRKYQFLKKIKQVLLRK